MKKCHHAPCVDIKDLSRPVAAGCNKTAVKAEAHTAYYALVCKGVYKVDVENTLHSGVEDGKPVVSFALQMWRKPVWIEFAKAVADVDGIGGKMCLQSGLALILRR